MAESNYCNWCGQELPSDEKVMFKSLFYKPEANPRAINIDGKKYCQVCGKKIIEERRKRGLPK